MPDGRRLRDRQVRFAAGVQVTGRERVGPRRALAEPDVRVGRQVWRWEIEGVSGFQERALGVEGSEPCTSAGGGGQRRMMRAFVFFVPFRTLKGRVYSASVAHRIEVPNVTWRPLRVPSKLGFRVNAGSLSSLR